MPPAGVQPPSGYQPGQPAGSTGPQPYSERGRRAAESGYVAPVGLSGAPVDRRAAESGYMAPVARPSRHTADEPATGGRRRRAEGQPTWQESRTGSHARPDEAPSGNHAAGRSVSDLLASHGGADSTPKTGRRRRRED
jgi:hypothetical protein